MNRFLTSLKQDFAEINISLKEGRAKIFARPVIAGIIALGVLFYANNFLTAQTANMAGQIASLETQKSKTAGYEAVKARALEAEEKLPQAKEKVDWLMGEVSEVFRVYNIAPRFSGIPEELQSANLSTVTVSVRARMPYFTAARIIAALESRPKTITVLNLALSKPEQQIGVVDMDMKIAASFPKEPLGPRAN